MNVEKMQKKNLEKSWKNYQKKKSSEARPGIELGTLSIQAKDTTSQPAGMMWFYVQNNNYLKCLATIEP